MLFLCTFVAFVIIGCAVGRSPQNEAFTNEVDAVSDLQVLMPIEVIKQPKKSKSALYYAVGNPGKLGLTADGPYSRIPDEEFLLEHSDSDDSLKKTTKKDLGSAKPYKKAYEQSSRNHAKPSAYKDLPTEFAHRCLEYMHQYKFVTLGKARYENQQEKSDHELMVRLCRKYLEKTYKPKFNAKVIDEAQNAASIVGFDGSGGGLGMENKGFNEHDGHFSNVAYSKQVSGAGNVGFDGEGGVLGNAGVEGKYGNFLSYILSGPHAPHFRATQHDPIVKYMSPSHPSGHHGNGKLEFSGNSGDKAVPFALMNDLHQLEIFGKLATDSEAQEVKETATVMGQEAANVQNVEIYDSKSQTEDEANVYKLISENRGGKALKYKVGSLGGQIGNLAVSSGHKQTGGECGHLKCVNVYLLDVNSLGGSRKAGTLQPSSQTLGKLPMPSSSTEGVPGKFRPIGGRRGWMVLDDPNGRLRQYINSKKPWLIL